MLAASPTVREYRDDIEALPWYLQSYRVTATTEQEQAKRAALPWWATAAIGLILVMLAMIPGDA